MDADAKKTALRMIPYGIYVLTADDSKGNVGAATVNWVTQSSFAPPLVVVGVKADSGAHTVVKGTGKFALNMLGKDQKGLAFTFFKPAKVEDGKLSGQAFHAGANGTPDPGRRHRRGRMFGQGSVELGDHHIVVGEVTEAYVMKPPTGPRRCRHPGNEGPRRHRLLRRLTPRGRRSDRRVEQGRQFRLMLIRRHQPIQRRVTASSRVEINFAVSIGQFRQQAADPVCRHMPAPCQPESRHRSSRRRPRAPGAAAGASTDTAPCHRSRPWPRSAP